MLSVEKALNYINGHKRVAIVGLSPKTDRPSHRVGTFLQQRGFDIVPVNPVYDEILGVKSVKNLSDLEQDRVDWVDLFVNPARLMDLVNDLISLKPGLVWCQIGVVNDEFNRKLTENGIDYIADVCPKIELEKST